MMTSTHEVYIGNLAATVNEAMLRAAFAPCGSIHTVPLPFFIFISRLLFYIYYTSIFIRFARWRAHFCFSTNQFPFLSTIVLDHAARCLVPFLGCIFALTMSA